MGDAWSPPSPPGRCGECGYDMVWVNVDPAALSASPWCAWCARPDTGQRSWKLPTPEYCREQLDTWARESEFTDDDWDDNEVEDW